MKPDSSVVRISRTLDERLDVLAAKTGRRKSYYASKAIAQFLEDYEDYLLAVEAYEASKGQRRYTLEELAKRLGWDGGDHKTGRKGSPKARSRKPVTRKKLSADVR